MKHDDFEELRKTLLDSVLEGNGTASRDLRRASFLNADLGEPMKTLIDKVANCSYAIQEDDIRAVRQSGMTEDEIFELLVCAAVGEASRQYEAALQCVSKS